MSFTEADHPRAATGAFRDKSQTAPEVDLNGYDQPFTIKTMTIAHFMAAVDEMDRRGDIAGAYHGVTSVREMTDRVLEEDVDPDTAIDYNTVWERVRERAAWKALADSMADHGYDIIEQEVRAVVTDMLKEQPAASPVTQEALEQLLAGIPEDPVHYRLYFDRNGAPVVICVQEFDYPDYDPKKFIDDERYDTHEAAQAALTTLFN